MLLRLLPNHWSPAERLTVNLGGTCGQENKKASANLFSEFVLLVSGCCFRATLTKTKCYSITPATIRLLTSNPYLAWLMLVVGLSMHCLCDMLMRWMQAACVFCVSCALGLWNLMDCVNIDKAVWFSQSFHYFCLIQKSSVIKKRFITQKMGNVLWLSKKSTPAFCVKRSLYQPV